jgi:hypothetical protein
MNFRENRSLSCLLVFGKLATQLAPPDTSKGRASSIVPLLGRKFSASRGSEREISDNDLSITQRAVNENSSDLEIDTLACFYAEIGKTKEARELLLRAMHSVGIDQPNEPIWYGFGRGSWVASCCTFAPSKCRQNRGRRYPIFNVQVRSAARKTLRSVNSLAVAGRP